MISVAQSAPGQNCGTWTRVADGPAPASSHGATFHDSESLVVFYDLIPGCNIDQTWGWNGQQWESLTSPEWGCRASYATAYDSTRSVTVLHGGSGNVSLYDDTIEYQEKNWEWRASIVPPPRAFHAMVYDQARGLAVMFGGLDIGSVRLDETWEWTGTGDWLLANPTLSPGGLAAHAMAFDAARSETILFGGSDASAFTRAETWSYDGVTWLKRSDTGPGERVNHAMIYDSRREVVVLFGGNDAGGTRNDLWEWDGSAWTEVQIPAAFRPPARRSHAMAFDSKRGVVVINGGSGPNNQPMADTWEYTPCLPDCDRDCDLDIFDYLCFQDKFISGHPYADFERDGDNDIFDFLAFLDEFVKGCG